jgi:ribonuclease HI
MHVICYTDGGVWPNPGPAAYSAVVCHPDGRIIVDEVRSLERGTNNDAEFEGILLAMRTAMLLGATKIEVRTDSLLALELITAKRSCVNERMRDYVRRVVALRIQFRRGGGVFTIIKVKRDNNTRADELCCRALGRPRVKGELPGVFVF